jgi:hypothetical protein
MADGPHYKTTTEIAPPPAWAIELSKSVHQGFADVEKRLDTIEANVDLQGSTVRDVQKRMTAQEDRMLEFERRQATQSERVRDTSKADMAHDAAIAEIRTAVSALAERPDTGAQVLAAVESLSQRPVLRRIGSALVPVLMLAISAIGIWLQATVSRLATAQPPQPPPPAFVVVVDGGAP